MKTAISIPDPLFQRAEELAADLGMSRSQLYSEAVHQFVESRKDSEITEALNRIYGGEAAEPDPAWMAMQWASIPRESW
jgi:predicted transcriptional regulator